MKGLSMRFILGLLLCLAALPASAQSWGPPPACAPPSFLGWSGTVWICNPATGVQGPAGPQGPIGLTGPAGPQGPAGSGTGSVTAGPGISVSSTGVVSINAPLQKEPIGRPIVATDSFKLLAYTGTVPGTFSLPASNAVGAPTGGICLKAFSTGSVIITSTAPIHGGPTTLIGAPLYQDECFVPDLSGGWAIEGPPGSAVANPNPVQ